MNGGSRAALDEKLDTPFFYTDLSLFCRMFASTYLAVSQWMGVREPLSTRNSTLLSTISSALDEDRMPRRGCPTEYSR